MAQGRGRRGEVPGDATRGLEGAAGASPGLTLADAVSAVLPHLPTALFPGGAHAGWWFKTVQLDLEAKHEIVRERTSPLRVHRA